MLMSQNQTPNLVRPDLIGIVEIVCGLKLRDWLRNSLVVQFVAMMILQVVPGTSQIRLEAISPAENL